MHSAINLIYLLLTNDITLVCLFAATAVYFTLIFYKNNLKNRAACFFSVISLGAVIFWLAIDIFPGVNPALLALYTASGAGLAFYVLHKRDNLFIGGKENADFGKLAALLAVLYAALVLKTAWLGDDSFITFRTVDNFIHGYGLTWNVEERIQAYTNTLWMFAVSAIYFVTGSIFISSMALSTVFMWLALYCLKKSSAGKAGFIVVFFALIMSKAFIDYSTSGLENPLTFCLLGFFYMLYFKPGRQENRIFMLSLTTSLIFLNKPDTILLVAFPLAYELVSKKRKAVIPAFLGFIPVAAWEIFSIIYYGFPLPNTFIA